MGKIKQGILGGFNGTTGSVVGASWKGIAYMRGKAQSIKNPRTENQMSNRGAFAELSELASRNLDFVRAGFMERENKMSAYNSFIKRNRLNNSFSVSQGEITTMLELMEWAVGTYYGGTFGAATISNNTLSVTANCDVASANAYVIGVAEDTLETVSDKQAMSDLAPKALTLNVPVSMQTHKVHFFGFIVDEVNHKVTNSVYFGFQAAA